MHSASVKQIDTGTDGVPEVVLGSGSGFLEEALEL